MMMLKNFLPVRLLILATLGGTAACTGDSAMVWFGADDKGWQWEQLPASGELVARHEAGFIELGGQLYLIGGRRVNQTSVYDPDSSTWYTKASPPLEIHHFQPVVLDSVIYIVGAMTGGWPNETPLDSVLAYFPAQDTFVYTHAIPESRRRGGAGAVVHEGRIYIVGGIVNGHMDGYKPWLDMYDPTTGEWTVLADAPFSRDHFHAVSCDGKLYVFGGRRSSRRTGEDMSLTVAYGNVYDFDSGSWLEVDAAMNMPTERAGSMSFCWQGEVVTGGGESQAQEKAHNEVEALNTLTHTWRRWPDLREGRHGTGFAILGDYVYTASGCGNRGGEPELYSIERLKLPRSSAKGANPFRLRPVYQQWHTVTLDFSGPESSENAHNNPFLDYKLEVQFSHADTSFVVSGFYAADGNAAQTGADAGSVWRVRFCPSQVGKWTYQARLAHAPGVALEDGSNLGEAIPLTEATGAFLIVASDKDRDGRDMRAHGRLQARDGYFYFPTSGKYWLKAGANSPENLFGYEGFDGTYRISAATRAGESQTDTQLHKFSPHVADWDLGDPKWHDDNGKGLIGAINYLASEGMNAIYLIVMNIDGDGQDVWPYRTPDDFTRFDVSKLAQWEIVFEHMQSQGILIHIVLQETENERLLDDGETGSMRKLILRELVARFAHHPALVWNLGEENGPAHWTPHGQNDAQRKAMATYLKSIDPYNNIVILHTHSDEESRSPILQDIIGFSELDGLSLQVAERTEAPEVVERIRRQSRDAGHQWLIAMDEIGMWHTGALTDALDPYHKTLRGDVLWGTLLSGAAGVEWYFGGKYPHNDLNSEDWRQRDQLWKLTNHARYFFETYLPYHLMEPNHALVDMTGSYCFFYRDSIYTIYLPHGGQAQVDLSDAKGAFSVDWYDIFKGGALLKGTVNSVHGGTWASLGSPPAVDKNRPGQDWVILLKQY